MIRHKRLAAAAAAEPNAKIVESVADYYDRVPITFLVPKPHAKAILEAAKFSGNILCQNVVVADHLILAKPRFPAQLKPPSKTRSKTLK
jgi:hypothetical protein